MKKKNKIYLYSALGLFVIVGIILGVVYFPVTEESLVSSTLGKYILKGEKYSLSANLIVGEVKDNTGNKINCEEYAVKNNLILIETNKITKSVIDTEKANRNCYTPFADASIYKNTVDSIIYKNHPSDCIQEVSECEKYVVYDKMGYAESSNCLRCHTCPIYKYEDIATRMIYTNFKENQILPKNLIMITCRSDIPLSIVKLSISHNIKTLVDIKKLNEIMRKMRF